MTTPPPAKAKRATVGKMNLLDALAVTFGSSAVLGTCFLLHSFMAG